ncbi:MAG: inorganic pyrophosphatase [Gammaproteobacteria bacterium]|jgi:inorganic pyrophosphatase
MTEYRRWRPHPWHGIEIGEDAPGIVNVFIEITPFDLIKYEVDKLSGYLKVDRPNRTSSLPPSLYGFIPRTLCAHRVKDLMPGSVAGDMDPLDICVLSERPVARAEIILRARVIGGLSMLDKGEADDKIIAVLCDDPVWDAVADIEDFPIQLIERLRHYFLSYKTLPDEEPVVEIGATYNQAHALRVIAAAADDYKHAYGGLKHRHS